MIYLSNEIKKPKSEIFCIKTNSRTDIYIEGEVRYVISGNRSPRSRMFHDALNMSECTRIDHSGCCMGHEMGLKEFVNTYCNGIMPDSM